MPGPTLDAQAAAAGAAGPAPRPAIAKDHDQNALNTITLSYTFYRLPETEQPVAEAPDTKSNRL